MHDILESSDFDKLLDDCATSRAGLYMKAINDEGEPAAEDLMPLARAFAFEAPAAVAYAADGATPGRRGVRLGRPERLPARLRARHRGGGRAAPGRKLRPHVQDLRPRRCRESPKGTSRWAGDG